MQLNANQTDDKSVSVPEAFMSQLIFDFIY